jgi:hypothetical protein
MRFGSTFANKYGAGGGGDFRVATTGYTNTATVLNVSYAQRIELEDPRLPLAQFRLFRLKLKQRKCRHLSVIYNYRYDKHSSCWLRISLFLWLSMNTHQKIYTRMNLSSLFLYGF